MNLPRALLAGALGGVIMSILMFLARLGGMDVNPEMMMGTTFLAPGPVAWVAGFLMHVVMSALIGLAYAWVFETVTKRANAVIGAAVSVVHVGIAGLVMGGVVPAVHRLIPEAMDTPGYFLAHLGPMGIVAFVVPHLVYGAIVGAMYADQVRRPRLTAGL